MKLEEQLHRIVEEHGLASLAISVFAGANGKFESYAPWISVDVQAKVDGIRFLGNARVEDDGIVPALTKAIHNLIDKIGATREPLAPLADQEERRA